MSREFTLKSGRELLPPDQLEQLVDWHRNYGLSVSLPAAGAPITLDGNVTGLVTEVLRLAALGKQTEAAARDGQAQPQAIIMAADAAWTRRF